MQVEKKLWMKHGARGGNCCTQQERKIKFYGQFKKNLSFAHLPSVVSLVQDHGTTPGYHGDKMEWNNNKCTCELCKCKQIVEQAMDMVLIRNEIMMEILKLCTQPTNRFIAYSIN